jgi:(S)-sulfolactate dehydrogenase
MRVIGYDPHREPWPDGVERFQTLEALLAEADFLSMHIPLAPETRSLIGARALARMKPTAILVDTARGGVVDEAAVAEAIRAGRLGGRSGRPGEQAARCRSSLAGLPNVVLTPHGSDGEAWCVWRRMPRRSCDLEAAADVRGESGRY